MCDVFLLGGLGVFELEVRGDVLGKGDADVISLVVRHLPDGCSAMIDLAEVDSFDHEAAVLLLEAIQQRQCDMVTFAIVVGHPAIGSILHAAGADSVAFLSATQSAARDALARAWGEREPLSA